MLKLPDQPTDQQIEAITLATIREVFEPNATDLQDLTIPGDGTWTATYSADKVRYAIEWDGDTFTKQVARRGS